MSLQVFMYHRILPEPFCEAVDTDLFKRQLDYLQTHYNILTPQETYDYIRLGTKPANSRPCAALTFDDGWIDNLLYVTPILKERKLQAMMAVSAGFRHSGSVRHEADRDILFRKMEQNAAAARSGDKSAYCNESELRELISSGAWSLEAHGTRHFTGKYGKSILAAPQGESAGEFSRTLKEDILNCREYMDNLTGKTGKIFFWPYGHYSDQAAQIVKECGYDLQFSVYKGSCRPNDSRLVLPRIGVSRWKKFHKNSIVFRYRFLEMLHGLFHTEKVCFNDFFRDKK